jgi:hypothetical protein
MVLDSVSGAAGTLAAVNTPAVGCSSTNSFQTNDDKSKAYENGFILPSAYCLFGGIE